MELKPASSVPLEELSRLVNDAFSNYFRPINMDPVKLSHWIQHDSIDMDESKVFEQDGEAVGFGLIARRGSASRLAAMGVVPSTAGKGVGTVAMARLVQEARDRGDSCLELEVVDQNERAIKMYLRAGFDIVRRLAGWECDSPVVSNGHPSQSDLDALESIPLSEAADFLTKHESPDLPWQVTGVSVASPEGEGEPLPVAYRLGQAVAIIADPVVEEEKVTIHSLMVAPDHRRQGQASRLAAAVLAKYPGKKWIAKARLPEEHGAELAAKFGFTRMPIGQVQMRLYLASPS
jgi:GNAT superfamily N-acetyltransferase